MKIRLVRTLSILTILVILVVMFVPLYESHGTYTFTGYGIMDGTQYIVSADYMTLTCTQQQYEQARKYAEQELMDNDPTFFVDIKYRHTLFSPKRGTIIEMAFPDD